MATAHVHFKTERVFVHGEVTSVSRKERDVGIRRNRRKAFDERGDGDAT